MFVQLLFTFVIGYLLGSIPSGFLVGKAWGVNVLEHGSGRTGGTNVWRATKQVLPLVITVIGDMLKAVVAVLVARYVFHSEVAASLAGLGAVLGHNWSIYLGGRGGAGGMTTGAALAILSPLAGVIAIPVALIALYLSRYASVGTLAIGVGGAVVLAILAAINPGAYPWQHLAFGIPVALAVIWALRPNLRRLVAGNERKISLW